MPTSSQDRVVRGAGVTFIFHAGISALMLRTSDGQRLLQSLQPQLTSGGAGKSGRGLWHAAVVALNAVAFRAAAAGWRAVDSPLTLLCQR